MKLFSNNILKLNKKNKDIKILSLVDICLYNLFFKKLRIIIKQKIIKQIKPIEPLDIYWYAIPEAESFEPIMRVGIAFVNFKILSLKHRYEHFEALDYRDIWHMCSLEFIPEPC